MKLFVVYIALSVPSPYFRQIIAATQYFIYVLLPLQNARIRSIVISVWDKDTERLNILAHIGGRIELYVIL